MSYIVACASLAIVMATGSLIAPTLNAAADQLPTISMAGIAVQPEAAVGWTTGYNNSNWSGAIHSIAFDENSLIAGYGDWDFNSDSSGGPNARTGIRSLNLTTKHWGSLLYTNTEANDVFRTINGVLYAPTTDPSNNSPTGGGGWATNASGTWQTFFPSDLSRAVHIFDIASLSTPDKDLWLFGATNNPANGNDGSRGLATVWHSTDGGQTWQTTQTDGSTPADATGGFERYYWGAAINGKLYTQAEGISPQSPMRVYDGASGTWSSLPYQPNCAAGSDHQVDTFDNQIICNADYADSGFYTFDGTNMHVQQLGNPSDHIYPIAMTVDSGYLYVLTSNNELMRTASFAQPWQALGSIEMPSSLDIARSIGVHEGYLYIGSFYSGIFQSTEPLALTVHQPNGPSAISADNCLADTGVDLYEYVAISLCLVAAAVGILYLYRRKRIRRCVGVAVVVAGGLFMSLGTPHSAFAATQCALSGGVTIVSGVTTGLSGSDQIYATLAKVVPGPGVNLVASSLRLSLIDNPIVGSTVSPDGLTVTVPGEGTYSADPTNGNIVFSPVSGFHGTTKGVRFTIQQTAGAAVNGIYTPNVQAVVHLPNITFQLTQNNGVYSISSSTSYQLAADASDYATGATLSTADQADIAQLIDLDPDADGIQTILDQSTANGYKLVYTPSSDNLAISITNQSLFDQFASQSCGWGSNYTIATNSQFIAVYPASVGFAGTGGSCSDT